MRICNRIMTDDMGGHYSEMALFMVGYIMMQCEHYGFAYHIYQRCAQLKPGISEVWSNMGMCLEHSDLEEAKKLFQKAYRIKEDNASAYANEALMWLQTANPQRCIELCDEALKHDPDLKAAIHNKGLAQLMLRQWGEGWKNYHDTLGVKHREKRDYGLPEWAGEPGKIIVYGEQGVGDEIMFASCLADLSKTNDIILDVDSRLESLFNRSFDFPVYGTRYQSNTPLMDDHADADYQCAIGQLPHFYRNAESDFPGTPFLKADPEQQIMWRALFDSLPGKKIGIAWRGGLEKTGGKRRSMTLDDISPLFNDIDTFISLEYKPVDEDELNRHNIKSYPWATLKGSNMDHLAALISELDYVVSCCTAVIHVAGALGVPCYCLVPDSPTYRYHLSGDFPWYNSVKLIRQKGTWRETVKNFAKKQLRKAA